MARYKRAASIWSRNHYSKPKRIADFDAIKNRVRDGLLSMNIAGREAFIQALETEMQCVRLSIRAYLIPLGMVARKPEELTPVEVAHLTRFLYINVPQAMPAIENAMARFSVFAEQSGIARDGLAA